MERQRDEWVDQSPATPRVAAFAEMIVAALVSPRASSLGRNKSHCDLSGSFSEHRREAARENCRQKTSTPNY
jgi:hypothetical protein